MLPEDGAPAEFLSVTIGFEPCEVFVNRLPTRKWYPVSSAISRTRARVSLDTSGWLLSARETVAEETPSRRANSRTDMCERVRITG